MHKDFHYILGRNHFDDYSEGINEFCLLIHMGRVTDNLPEPLAGKSYSIPNHNEGMVKILIVEDNEVNQLILARNLQYIGYDVDLANNGKEAVEKVRESEYDVILMDINMPIMDGVKATEIIRKKLNLNIPIISITANTFESDKQKYLAAGMSDYLKKPFRKDDLLEMLDKHIS